MKERKCPNEDEVENIETYHTVKCSYRNVVINKTRHSHEWISSKSKQAVLAKHMFKRPKYSGS